MLMVGTILKTIKIFNYTVYERKTESGQQHDGVAIAIKHNIKHIIVDDLEENYLAIEITTTLGEIMTATGYQPPRRPQIPINNMVRLIRYIIPVYLLGDLNARHRILGHSNDNFV